MNDDSDDTQAFLAPDLLRAGRKGEGDTHSHQLGERAV